MRSLVPNKCYNYVNESLQYITYLIHTKESVDIFFFFFIFILYYYYFKEVKLYNNISWGKYIRRKIIKYIM